MVPEQSPETPPPDDTVLAGYRECATEAMKWLSALGYRPGHPLMRSLAAHLTKKQAYLEKINLESFLIDGPLRSEAEEEEEEEEEEDDDGGEEEGDSGFGSDREEKPRGALGKLRNDPEIQKFLVEAVFRGCDLRYQ